MEWSRRHIISSDMFDIQHKIALATVGAEATAALYADLPLHPSDAPRWIPWEVFVEAQDRMRAQGVTGEVLRAAVVKNFHTQRTMAHLRMVGGIADPVWVWTFFSKTVLLFFLPIAKIRVTGFGPGLFDVDVQIPTDARPCPDFFLSSAGSFEEVCNMLGFGPARVTAAQITPWHTRLSLQTAPKRRAPRLGTGFLERIGRLGARTAELVAQRHELELTLAQTLRATADAGRMLELANRRSEASAAAVSSERQTRRALNHALRTPLNHVVAATSLLADVAADNATLRRLLGEIDSAATDLLAVVARPASPPADP